MLKGRKNSSDVYSEKLIPTRVTITRRRGDYTYVFEIDGFRGARTGQIHYKGSEVSRIEKFLASNNPIYSFTSTNVGLILGFENPMIVASESIPTGTLAASDEIFRLQPGTQQISLPQFIE
jgi:hypothetical protein